MDWLIWQAQNFILVAIRAGFLLFFCPPWDSRIIPMQVRVYSILVISLILTPVVASHLPPFPGTWIDLGGLVIREFLLGLSFGLVIRFVMAGVQMAGNLLSIQMGFGMVTLFDPQTRSRSTIIADLFVVLATLIFLAIDGHHALLSLLTLSFQEAPMGRSLTFPMNLFHFLPAFGAVMYQLAVKLAAPVLAVLFLTQVALGLVARAVSQIQVMIVSFPLTIALGLIFLSFTLTMVGPYLADQLSDLRDPLHQVLRAWQG